MQLPSLTYLLDDSDIKNDLKIIKAASKNSPVSRPSRSSIGKTEDNTEPIQHRKTSKKTPSKLEEASRDSPVSSPSRSSVPSSSKDGNSQNMKSTSKPDGYGVSKQSSGNNRLKGVLRNIISI